MNLYLLEQDEVQGYDVYDSIVVIAKNSLEASKIAPPYCNWKNSYSSWCSKPENVTVTLIGKAAKGLTGNDRDNPNIIIASFNAG